MPLSSFALTLNNTFAFEKDVPGWAALTQGDNQVTFGLTALDVAVWDSAYAALLPLAGGADTTIDLGGFTDLAGDETGFTAVLGIVVKVVPTVAADDDVSVSIGPGDTNGLEWFYGGSTLAIAANEGFAFVGDPEGAGVTIDGTHKTLKLDNLGTDAATVTVVVVGTTL